VLSLTTCRRVDGDWGSSELDGVTSLSCNVLEKGTALIGRISTSPFLIISLVTSFLADVDSITLELWLNVNWTSDPMAFLFKKSFQQNQKSFVSKSAAFLIKESRLIKIID